MQDPNTISGAPWAPLDWAHTEAALSVLVGPFRANHPEGVVHTLAALADLTTGARFGGELSSSRRPHYSPPEPGHEDVLPIDVVFGTYFPRRRQIEIYDDNIQCFSQRHGWSAEHVRSIVRCHEHAHALVHLGLPLSLAHEVMLPPDGMEVTNWGDFTRWKYRWLKSIDEAGHEFLAQALTYSAICKLPTPQRFELAEAFDLLESFQAKQYHLSAEMKERLSGAEWAKVFVVLNHRYTCRDAAPLPLSSSFRESFEELIRMFSDAPRAAWVEIAEIEASQATADQPRAYMQSKTIYPEFLVDRVGGLKISVFAREHPPPHFNVRYGNQSANFRIDTGAQINGGLCRHRRAIDDWYRANRAVLIQAWNSHRPTDCPVGPIVE